MTPSATTTDNKFERTFQFVPYGESFSPSLSLDDDDNNNNNNKPTISCDGRIKGGVSLELSHWNGNETQDEYYADTSTEMALNLPPEQMANAVVLNNH